MNDLDLMLLRRTVEGHAAKATGILLTDGDAACDAYLDQVGYRGLLDTLRAEGGLR